MFPVDFGNVYRLGPNCTPARGYFHVTQINTYESTLSVFHKPNQACATKRRHRLGECECSPSLIHCFKHWLGAFISLNLPHALALSLSLSPTSPDLLILNLTSQRSGKQQVNTQPKEAPCS